MDQNELKELVYAADDAINRRDFDALMEFYDPDAILVVKPGKMVSGRTEIRKAFVAISDYFKNSLVVKQGEIRAR
jgi:uncharacterized protein (TIGR02246 family)